MTQGDEQIGVRFEEIGCPSCGRTVDLREAAPLTAVACPSCGGKLFVPVQLGQFRLVGLLGTGTTAAAYRAIDTELDRSVAVKLMHLESKGDDDATNRFLAEARALAALRHRNVVRIFTMGRDHHVPYLVMELIGGGSVRNLIHKDKPIEEARALEIAIGVAEGLQAAHAIGLIHGDVKPANILLDEQGVPKIVDFGLARFGGVRMEREGMGTPFYVAPERIRQKDTDHRSDIYSLGATLFHLIAGEPVFDAKTIKDVLLAHIRKPAPDIRTYRPSLGARTAAVLAKMLQKAPADRYATYDELLADLRAAMPGAAAPARGDAASLAAIAAAAAASAPPAVAMGQSLGKATSSAARPGGPPRPGGAAGRPAMPVPGGTSKRPAAAPKKDSQRKELTKLIWVVLGVVGAAAAVGGVCLLVYYMQKPSDDFNMYPDKPREPIYRPDDRTGADTDTDSPPRRPAEEEPTTPDSSSDPFPEPGVQSQGADGSFILTAMAARIESSRAPPQEAQPKYEPDKDCLGFWWDEKARLHWEMNVVQAGQFVVTVEFACDKGHQGGSYVLQVGQSRLTGQVTDTGGWLNFKTDSPGQITLPAGRQTLTLISQNKKGPRGYLALMNLRSIRLARVK